MQVTPEAAAPGLRANLAAVLERPRRIELRELAVPSPGERELLIQVRSVGVCGSDVHYYEEGRVGGFVVRSPLVLGHEAAGVGRATDIHPDREHPVAADLIGQLGQALLAPSAAGDAGARGSERAGAGRSDAGGRAGDQDDLALE